MTDRTQPPPHVGTASGFWSDSMGLANGYATVGSNHTSVHFDAGGYAWAPSLKVGCIDRYRDPLSSNDPNGVRDLVWHNFDPWNPGAAQPNIPPPPPLPTPTDPLPGVPAIEVPAELACPAGYYRAVVGPDAGKCLPIGPGAPIPTPPVMGSDLRLMNGRFNVVCRYDASERGAGAGPALAQKYSEASGAFTFFDVAKWEVVVSYAAAAGGLMVSAMTDVAFTLTIRNLQAGETKTFSNPAGHLLGVVVVIA